MLRFQPIHLPGLDSPHDGVLAVLTIAATRDGDTVVGYDVRELESRSPLALGCAPPCTREDLATISGQALDALRDAVASLLDWPPFDD